MGSGIVKEFEALVLAVMLGWPTLLVATHFGLPDKAALFVGMIVAGAAYMRALSVAE